MSGFSGNLMMQTSTIVPAHLPECSTSVVRSLFRSLLVLHSVSGVLPWGCAAAT